MPSTRKLRVLRVRRGSYPPAAGRGFTLIELLAVLGVVAILATIAMRIGACASERAAIKRARSELTLLAGALEEYRRIFSDYPQGEGGALLQEALSGGRGPTGALSAPRRPIVTLAGFTLNASGTAWVDPWGKPYAYTYPAPGHRAYLLFSTGPAPAFADDDIMPN